MKTQEEVMRHKTGFFFTERLKSQKVIFLFACAQEFFKKITFRDFRGAVIYEIS